MMHLTVHLSEKKLKNTKNESFNTLTSREMESTNMESKERIGKYVENPLEWMKNHG